MKQIVIDGNPYIFTASDLPLMIHGNEKAGASLFSIVTAASICRSGNPLFFWSGYPMAKQEFSKEIEGMSMHRIQSADEITGDEPQIIIMESETPEDLSASLSKIDAHRILFVKNFEILPEALRKELLRRELLIVAGDLKDVLTKDAVQKFKTQIFFSPYPGIEIPTLNKYEGFVAGKGKAGLAL